MSSPEDQSPGCLNRSLKWISKKWPYLLGLTILIAVLIILTLLFTVYQDSVTPRVIGGQDALEGKYPYIVSFGYEVPTPCFGVRYLHDCGGTILNERWILTAAHCLDRHNIMQLKPYMRVIVGINHLDDEDGQKHMVANWVIHDDYIKTTNNISNDIALILLEEDIEFNDRVEPVILTREDFKKDDYPVTVIGWGSRSQFRTGATNTLQELTLKSLINSKCKTYYEMSMDINESHTCASTKFLKGVCSGDSGGPLVADGVQIGVASFATMICAIGGPDVFARVYFFLNWINNTIDNYAL